MRDACFLGFSAGRGTPAECLGANAVAMRASRRSMGDIDRVDTECFSSDRAFDDDRRGVDSAHGARRLSMTPGPSARGSGCDD